MHVLSLQRSGKPADENRSDVASPARTFAHREIIGHLSNEKHATSGFREGVERQSADMAKSEPAVQHVKDRLRTGAIDGDLYFSARIGVP